MKALALFLIALPAFAVQKYQATPDERVICEIAMAGHDGRVNTELNNMLLRHEFRLVDYAHSAPLLALYGLKPSPFLSAATVSFRRWDTNAYRLTLFDAPGHAILKVEIPIRPLYAWPLVDMNREALEYEYSQGLASSSEILQRLEGVPDEVHFGTLPRDEVQARLYFSAEKIGEQVYINMGIDLPESFHYDPGVVHSHLLRNRDGWVRRVRVLTFAIDDEYVRARLEGQIQ